MLKFLRELLRPKGRGLMARMIITKGYKMFGAKEITLKIKETEWNKLREDFKMLVEENDSLKRRANFEHLLRDINTLTEEKKRLQEQIHSLEKTNASLSKTLDSERHTASLVLKKLKEVTDTCEYVYERNKLKESVYVKACDVYA
jgi:chromosome segregation ATPase